MLYLMLVGLFIGYIDSSKIEITTRPGKIKIFNQNGSMKDKSVNLILSLPYTLDYIEANLLNGGIKISCPPFTQIFPQIKNGKIKGDLFFEKSDIFQKIECNVNNGDIKIKRR